MKYIILSPELFKKIKGCGMELKKEKSRFDFRSIISTLKLKAKLDGYELCKKDILMILNREAMFWDKK